jgi:hypothetical protein
MPKPRNPSQVISNAAFPNVEFSMFSGVELNISHSAFIIWSNLEWE